MLCRCAIAGLRTRALINIFSISDVLRGARGVLCMLLRGEGTPGVTNARSRPDPPNQTRAALNAIGQYSLFTRRSNHL